MTFEFPDYPSYQPRYTVLVRNAADCWTVGGFFPNLLYATDFAQGRGFAAWQLWENLPGRARYLDNKTEYETRLYSRRITQPFAC